MANASQILVAIRYRTKENPVFSAELERAFGMTGAEVRNLIRELRREGHPIANDKGYYYAKSYEEFKPTLDDLEHRAESLFNTVKKFKIAFGIETSNQSSLF